MRGLEVEVRKLLSSGFMLQVRFGAPPGITILFGPSGAGKTTVLDCIAGLLAPDSGHIRAGERVLFDSQKKIDVTTSRRAIGYVFQTLALFPHLTVEQNIAYGLASVPDGLRRERIEAILDSFRISRLRRQRPGEVSGGERQRVALARALVTEPQLLLLDEPLAALDSVTKAHIVDDLRRWNDAHRIPILYVTHSREEVFALGEQVIALEQGRVVAQGSPQEVLSAPRRESLAQLAGFENILDAKVVSLHEESGTMTCRPETGDAQLEAPLGRFTPGERVRLGIRAGDILLATAPPQALSARNVLPGKVVSLERRDVTIIARVDCGIVLEVHLTPGAQHSLELAPGRQVWLVIKTYSCHLLR